MIPQAIASVGVYADLWSHLKSMDHALERAQRAKTIKDLADLDKARLIALGDFVKKELEPKDIANMLSSGTFFSSKSVDLGYSLDKDLRTTLQDLPSFKQWLKAQKLSTKDKSAKLIEAFDDYLINVNQSLFPDNLPEEEFKILHELLSKLLLQTESELIM